MRNKYVLSRSQEVGFVRDHLDEFLENSMALSRYTREDPDYELAKENFKKAYDYILAHPDVENDYPCLIELHKMLMKGLDSSIHSSLSEEQIAHLEEMINQPAKANVEIAIDVMIYILEKRLFSDGDVRVALMFANKIMIDCGCGFITIQPKDNETYRSKLKALKAGQDNNLKDWIYQYCVKGLKTESQF